MNEVQTRPGLLHRVWQRTVDGDRTWGSIDIRPDRFGVTRYRLVVYPPGISPAERRRVRVARGWPLWGAVAWILLEITTTQLTGPWTALAISTSTVVAGGLIAAWLAGDARRRVRVLTTSTMVGCRDPQAQAAAQRLKALAGTLFEADDRVRDGRMTPAEHELIWWQVYDGVDVS
jgi:hypothetical protein